MDALGRAAFRPRPTLSGPSPAASERRLLLAAYAAIACIGLYVGAIGPSLEAIADDAGVSLGTAGLVLAALATGSVTGSATVTAWLHRRRQRLVAAAGMLLMAAGLIGLATVSTWPLLLGAAFVTGAGGGLTDAGTHGLAAVSTQPAVAVSRLNIAFALGAIAGPIWAGSVLQLSNARWLVYGVAAFAAMAAFAGLLRAPDSGRAAPVHHLSLRASAIPMVAILMALVLFLYVGAEIGLGAWTTSATQRAADANLLAGALVTSGYWAALFLGRVVSGAAVARGAAPGRVLGLSIAGAGAGSVALAVGGEVLAVGAIAAVVTGFCFGPIWPSAMTVAAQGSPANTPALLVTVGNGGGIVLPWLQGRILADNGTRAGMGMSAALCAGMMALMVLSRASRRRGREETVAG